MYYSTQKKLLIVGGADFSADLFKEVYDNETPIIAADGGVNFLTEKNISCLLYTSPSPRDMRRSRMPSSA